MCKKHVVVSVLTYKYKEKYLGVCFTLSPVISLFPAGFHFITVTSELCWALLEKVDIGRVFPSTTQHETIPVEKKVNINDVGPNKETNY
jgi:hypothetical protein